MEDVDVTVTVDGKSVEVDVKVEVHPLSELPDEEIKEAVERAAEAAIKEADRIMLREP